MYEKFYVHEIAAVDLSKIYFLKNAMKTCKPNNHDFNRDWINMFGQRKQKKLPIIVESKNIWSYNQKYK